MVFLSVFVLQASCGDGLSPMRDQWTLSEESGEELENAPAVARFRLSGAAGFHVDDVWLVSGDVSSVSQGKLERGEIPRTVEEQRQSLVVWLEGRDAILAPTTILEAGSRYSFVALGVGLLGSFLVSEEERPILRLLGDPVSESSGEIIYCLDTRGSYETDLQDLDGLSGFSAGVSEQRAGDHSCVRTQFIEAQEFFLPPPSVGEFLFEPTPIERVDEVVRTPMPPLPGACSGEELFDFSGGCLEAAPGAVLVHLSPGFFALSLRDAEGFVLSERVVRAEEEETHALGPLASQSTYRVDVTAFSPGASSSGESSSQFEIRSGSAAPRFVLTELLADPLGNEPQSEWIEVVNIGSGVGSLKDFQIWDSSDGAVLPDVELEPGEVGLIVREDFSFESDEIPHFASVPVPVTSLGENGLRNSGEEVSLRSPDGRVLSKIVPLATRAGESVARIEPWAPDIPASFVSRAPPTPGSP